MFDTEFAMPPPCHRHPVTITIILHGPSCISNHHLERRVITRNYIRVCVAARHDPGYEEEFERI